MASTSPVGPPRYLLAATFGNVHGLYAPGKVQLRPEILRDGQNADTGLRLVGRGQDRRVWGLGRGAASTA